MRMILTTSIATLLLAGCGPGGSDSYQAGYYHAQEAYGSLSAEDMFERRDRIVSQAASLRDQADQPSDWWNGFCDSGQALWVDRASDVNKAMGMKVLTDEQVERMFDQTRSSFSPPQ